jgi:ABC-type antimicrobial peptide transport system permease subunit
MINKNQKSAKIHRLVVLPFWKSVEISIKSIRVRFLRALITTTSLILAIAFLTFIDVSKDIANSLLAQNDPELSQRLLQSGYDLSPGERQVDSSPKQRWIVLLSLLVCVVGIINAQLMAVTERFREIGTMKCLGALDRFILRLFLLEAIIQGFVGAVIGALSGGFLALANGFLHFGAQAISTLLWSQAASSLITAVGVGTFLSLVGVFYPALLAARMQPVTAMRTEH